MSIWPASQGTAPALFGAEGELVLLQISVEPRLLEDLLEVLARLDFPVNPQLYHKQNSVTVAFPAYSGRIEEVERLVKLYNFDPACLTSGRALIAHA